MTYLVLFALLGHWEGVKIGMKSTRAFSDERAEAADSLIEWHLGRYSVTIYVEHGNELPTVYLSTWTAQHWMSVCQIFAPYKRYVLLGKISHSLDIFSQKTTRL